MIKILHIVPTYLPAHRYGGPIRSVHDLNKSLVAAGAEITVYTTNIDGPDYLAVPMNKVVDIDGVKVFYFRSSRFFRFWFYSGDLHNKLRSLSKFDLVHITSIFLAASTLGSHYAKKFNKPYIISPRGSLMLNPLKSSWFKKWLYIKIFEKRNLRNASAIHFTTELEKENYLASGLPIKKAILIPNGLEMKSQISNLKSQTNIQNFRNKYRINKEAKIILSLGRLSWIKGFDTLIPAFAEVVKKDFNVVLIIAGGDDGYESNLKSQISNLKSEVKEKIILTGDLRSDDKIAAYQSADIFVMSSYSENFGISAVEAMGHDVPVIVTDTVGIASDIKEAEAGIVIKKNVGEFKDAILSLLSDEKLRSSFIENGKKLVLEKYSWSEIANRWIEEYKNLITLQR